MSGTGDTILRQWLMLRSIPRYPRKASTADISSVLIDEGYDITVRTVQRDLDSLSLIFGYTNETEGRTNYWFWPPDAKLMDLPGIEPASALVFTLADDYLNEVFPKGVTEFLNPYFKRAREILNSEKSNAFSGWRNRIRIIDRGPQLSAPAIKVEIQDAIYESILRRKVITAKYQPRNEKTKEYELNPAGLVFKNGVIYLVATAWDYENFIQFALHRFQSVAITDRTASIPSSLNFKEYVEAQRAFSYPRTNKDIQLVAQFQTGAALHLFERPLSKDQLMKNIDHDKVELKASIKDTDELRWWLLGFGDQVEVIKPKPLRRWHSDMAKSMSNIYKP